MTLTQQQKDVLAAIQGKLIRGDIGKIADATEFSREHVGKVLSLSHDYFNQIIIDAATDLIKAREKAEKESLKKLSSANV